MPHNLLRLAYAACCLFALMAAFLSVRLLMAGPAPTMAYHRMHDAPDITLADAPAAIDSLRELLASPRAPEQLSPTLTAWLSYPVHIDLWKDTVHIGEAIALGGSPTESVAQLRQSFHQLQQTASPDLDASTLSLTFFYNPASQKRTVSRQERASFYAPATHGVFFTCGTAGMLMPNVRWVSQEWSRFAQAANTYMKWIGCDNDAIPGGYGTATRFDTTQLVQHRKGSEVEQWQQGAKPTATAFTRENVTRLKDENIGWLLKHMRPDGSLPYTSFANGMPSTPNQLIRQWLATLALGREAAQTSSPRVKAAFLRNLHYNLTHYLVRHEDYAFFSIEGQAGWTATNTIAAEALRLAAAYEPELLPTYRLVIQGILHNWHEDGRFNNRFSLTPTNANHEDTLFMPGAALLALREASAQGIAIPTDKIARSLATYHRLWSENGKGLAPWLILGAGEWATQEGIDTEATHAMIFAMADRLVACQSPTAEHGREPGAFDDAQCPQSSNLYLATAQRIEGLTTAQREAIKLQDHAKAERYSNAIALAYGHVFHGQSYAKNSIHMDTAHLTGTVPYSHTDSHVRIDAPPHVIAAAHRSLRDDSRLRD